VQRIANPDIGNREQARRSGVGRRRNERHLPALRAPYPERLEQLAQAATGRLPVHLQGFRQRVEREVAVRILHQGQLAALRQRQAGLLTPGPLQRRARRIRRGETPSPLQGLRVSRVYGREGAIFFESNGLFAAVYARKKKRVYIPGLRDLAGYRAMWRDFAAALAQDREPELDFDTARLDYVYLDAAARSAAIQSSSSARTPLKHAG
jgi:hypothetical protein